MSAWCRILVGITVLWGLDPRIAGGRVTSKTRRVYAQQNASVIITCNTAEVLSESHVIWYRDKLNLDLTSQDDRLRGDVRSDGSLFIAQYTQPDAGLYWCKRQNSEASLIGQPVQLTTAVNEPIVFSNQVSAVVGDTVRLQCPVENWLPHPEVTWYKGDNPILNGSVELLPCGVLYIINVTEDDTGDYSCRAQQLSTEGWTGSQNSLSLEITNGTREFNVLASPPPTSDVTVGDPITLECSINSVNGEYSVWRHKRDIEWQIISNDEDRTEISANNVLYRSTLPHDALTQEYKCTIMSSLDDVIEEVITTVTLNAPTYDHQGLTDTLTNRTVDSNLKTTLRCSNPGFSVQSRTWLKNGDYFNICHDIQIRDEGLLQIDFTSESDKGYYQCLITTNGGLHMIATYRLNVKLPVAPQPPPVITKLVLTDRTKVQVSGRLCPLTPESSQALAFQYDYSETRCSPEVLTVQEIKQGVCDLCEETEPSGIQCQCCEHIIDVPAVVQPTEYMITLSRIDVDSITKSVPKTIILQPGGNVPSPVKPDVIDTEMPEPERLFLNVTNFGSGVLLEWNHISDATGYLIIVKHYIGDELVNDREFEVPATQNFTVVKGNGQRFAVGVLVSSKTHPDYAEVKDIGVLAEAPGYPAPLLPALYPTTGLALLCFIQWRDNNVTVDSYTVVYQCDKSQGILRMEGGVTMVQIPGADAYCDIMVGPIIDGKTSTANFTRYDRFCQGITTPANVVINPQTSFAVDSAELSLVTVSWDTGSKSCEVTYKVIYKPSDESEFADDDKVDNLKGTSTILALKKDIMYDIQILAYTEDVDNAVRSDVHTFTPGLPGSVQDLAIDHTGSPDLVTVTWSPPFGTHTITLYIVKLYQLDSHGEWLDVRTMSVEGQTHTQLTDLEQNGTYNISVGSMNLYGLGGVVSQGFTTPCTTACTEHEATVKPGLTDEQLGYIIGVGVAVVFLVTTVVICIMFSRRFKRGRHQHNVHTYLARDMEMNGKPYLPEEDDQELHECRPLQELSEGSSTARDFGSPFQLSNKATSAQDSGIADDHRSSQNLEEYESQELLEASLSMDKLNYSPARWSCEIPANLSSYDQNGRTGSLPTRTQSYKPDKLPMVDVVPNTCQVPPRIDSLSCTPPFSN